jgi:hypothetical protein
VGDEVKRDEVKQERKMSGFEDERMCGPRKALVCCLGDLESLKSTDLPAPRPERAPPQMDEMKN